MTIPGPIGRSLTTLAERTPDGFLLLARDGTVEWANPAARAILAVEDEPIEGSVSSRWFPDLDPRTPRAGTEMEAVSSRDERFPVEVSVTSFVEEDGEHSWIVFRDASRRKGHEISQRKYSEDLERILGKRTRELDELRQRHRALYDLAPVLDFELDSQGAIASANRKACLSLGVSIDRLVGLPLSDLAVGEERRRLDKTLENVREGSLAPFDTKLRSSDGSVLDILFHSCRTDLPMRPTIRLVGLDVTARREAERLVDQSLDLAEAQRARMERILRGIGEGVVVTDPDGQVRLMNVAAQRLFDLSEANAFGRDLFSDQRDVAFVRAWQEFVLGQETIMTTELTSSDNGEHTYAVTVSRVHTPEGRPAACVAVLRDVSAERLDDLKRHDFLANVTQELRSPLASIRGFTATVLHGERVPPEDVHRFLSIVEGEAVRLQHLIEDLSALSVLESGRELLRARQANFCTLLHEARDQFSPIAEERGVTLDVAIHTIDGSGVFDPEKMRRVLDNLIGNAIRFTPTGGAVAVELEREGGRFECAVRDDGRGMSDDVLARIFDCFSSFGAGQAHPPGTGLGLHISRRLVELHHGGISARSRPGEGSTFCFWIPVAPGADAPAGEDLGGRLADALEDDADPVTPPPLAPREE